MNEWTTNEENNMISKADAIKYAKEIARSNGFKEFKVFYDNIQIASTSDMPEEVDKTLIRVSALYKNGR